VRTVIVPMIFATLVHPAGIVAEPGSPNLGFSTDFADPHACGKIASKKVW
jgi:hypothetical protein